MAANRHCPQCGAEIPPDAKGELCPKCSLRLQQTEDYSESDPRTHAIHATHDAERSGSFPENIGPYRLLQKLGEGGMGEVYEAEQQEPLRRKVALKLIKWGMDTKEVVARFESERQALALMNHPNIARVYDAGATEQGRP